MERIKKIVKEQTKILHAHAKELAPAIALAVAIAIIATIFADALYQPKKLLKRGFQIELSADGKPVVKKEEKPVDLGELMKLADISRGEKIFKKCASCHTAGKNEAIKVGPNLFGIIGRPRASFAGFAYSDAMKAKGGNWDLASINQFITKPKDFISGTKMAFPGLKKPQDRADVILFLESKK